MNSLNVTYSSITGLRDDDWCDDCDGETTIIAEEISDENQNK